MAAVRASSFPSFDPADMESDSGSTDSGTDDVLGLTDRWERSKHRRKWCKLRAVAWVLGRMAAKRKALAGTGGGEIAEAERREDSSSASTSAPEPTSTRGTPPSGQWKDHTSLPDDMETINTNEPQPLGFFGKRIAEAEWARKQSIVVGAGYIENSESGGSLQAQAQTLSRKRGFWAWVATLRNQVWELMSNPDSGFWAYTVSMGILFLIVISSITFCLETMEEFASWKPIFSTLDFICGASFTVEYVLKLVTAPHAWSFVKAPMNVIDLVAILPFITSIFTFVLSTIIDDGGGGIEGTQILRVIRLVRVFRVLKLGGRFSKMQVVGAAVYDSMDMLGMLGFLLLLSMILFSTLIYFCEKDRNPEGSTDPFHSIPASFWWCIVTLMTVGYGDVVPSTTAGQIVASAAMLASIIILALPISVIGANFTQQWVIYKDNEKMKEQADKLGPHFKELVRSMTEHNSVMEELLNEIRIIESQMEKLVTRIRNKLDKVKAEEENGNVERSDYSEDFQMQEPELDTAFEQANYLQEMLEERLKQIQLVSSEEFSNLLQLCSSRHKKAKNKIEEGRLIRDDVEELNEEVIEVQALIQASLVASSISFDNSRPKLT